MKHIIPFLLILSLFFLHFAFFSPVQANAAEDFNSWINVFDFATANDSGSYDVSFQKETVVTFQMPFRATWVNYDFIVESNDINLKAYIVTPTGDLECDSFKYDDWHYRFYADNRSYGSDTLQIKFVSSWSSGWVNVNFKKFNVGIVDSRYFQCYSEGFLIYNNNKVSIPYKGSSVNHSFYFNDTYTLTDFGFSVYITPNRWKKFDYIDLVLSISCDSISSVSVNIGNTVPNFTVNEILPDMNSNYFISLRIDLTDVVRSKTNNLAINVSGRLNTAYGGANAGNNLFQISSCVGSISQTLIDSDSYWLRIVDASISAGFSDVLDVLEGLVSGSGEGSAIKEQGSQIGSDMSAAQAQLDAVDKPSGSNITAIDSLGSVGFAANTSYLTQIVNTKYIKEVFVFVAIMAILSLVLFGTKKGG